MAWKESKMTFDGITCPIVEDVRDNMYRWKRSDGFGHMTDEEVAEYKRARPGRYPEATFAPLEV